MKVKKEKKKDKHPLPQIPKNKNSCKVSTFKDLPITMDFDGLGICFHFGRWCHLYLCAEFNGLNGTSIMETIVTRSGHLSQKPKKCKN